MGYEKDIEVKLDANHLQEDSSITHSSGAITYDLAKPFSSSTYAQNKDDGISLWSIDNDDSDDEDKISYTASEKFTEDQLPSRTSIYHRNNHFELEEDITSIAIISPVTSIPFFMSVFVMVVQVTILALCMESLIDEAGPGNRLHVPDYNTVEEILAQALALLVSLFASRDIVKSLSVFDVRYGKEEENAVASKWKWYLLNFVRFAIASLGLVVTFCFILQGTEVLDLFLDFAAVQFVSELDDIAFHLAKAGVLGDQMLDAAIKASQVELSYCRKSEGNLRPVKVIGYSLLFCMLIAPWTAVKVFQSRGVYFKADCQTFHVYFENNSFKTNVCDTLYQQGLACPEWSSTGLTSVRYEFFSDIYSVDTDQKGYIETKNHRPIYYQRGFDNSDPESGPYKWGKISYCQQVNAWVFSIEGLKKGANADDCSWLIKSPETDAFNLDQVPEGDWVAWTGRIVETVVDITCIECDAGEIATVGCNFHGNCSATESTCQCETSFLGYQCEVCAACETKSHNGNFFASAKAKVLSIVGNETVANELFQFNETSLFEILLKDDTPVEVYDRQVYYIEGSKGDLMFLVYTGGTYSIRLTTSDQLNRKSLTEYLETFHSFWDSNSTLLFETQVTREMSSIGLQWFSAGSNTIANFSFDCTNMDYEDKCILSTA